MYNDPDDDRRHRARTKTDMQIAQTVFTPIINFAATSSFNLFSSFFFFYHVHVGFIRIVYFCIITKSNCKPIPVFHSDSLPSVHHPLAHFVSRAYARTYACTTTRIGMCEFRYRYRGASDFHKTYLSLCTRQRDRIDKSAYP